MNIIVLDSNGMQGKSRLDSTIVNVPGRWPLGRSAASITGCVKCRLTSGSDNAGRLLGEGQLAKDY